MTNSNGAKYLSPPSLAKVRKNVRFMCSPSLVCRASGWIAGFFTSNRVLRLCRWEDVRHGDPDC